MTTEASSAPISPDLSLPLPPDPPSSEPVSDGPPSFRPAPVDPVTRDYVTSVFATPSTALFSSPARADFISGLLGDPQLADEAEDDRILHLQLASRAIELARQAFAVLDSSSPIDSEHVLSTLTLFASKWPILLDDIVRTEIVRIIVVCLRRLHHHPTVAARGLTALRTFSVTDSMRRDVMFHGAVELALELMQEHAADNRVQYRAAIFIANVAFGCPHRKRRIARQTAVAAVVHGMEAFPDNDRMQTAGALMVRNLTADAQVNQYIAGNEGAVEAIAAALLRFRASSSPRACEVRLQCVLALESLCRDDDRNTQRLVNVDHTYMAAPDSDAGLSVSPAFKADPYADEQAQELVNEDGDVVVDEEELLTLNETPHFSHGAALCPGRAPLVASLSSSAGSDRTMPGLGSDRAPASHDRSSEVEEPAQRNQNEQSRKKSIIRALIHTIRRDPDDTLLLETCLSLLTRVALNRGELQARIGQLGGIHVAIASMKRHPKSKPIVSNGSSFVRCLCLQESNRNLVTSGLQVLISCVKEFEKDADVVRELVSALSNAVFGHEKNRSWVISHGGIEAVVQAVNRCGDKDVMVLEAGLCALRTFVDSSCTGALSAVQEGAVNAAVTALSITKDASSTGQQIVQEQAVLFLVDMAKLAPQSTDVMEEMDAADWIENSLAKLPLTQHPELHTAGDELINALAGDSPAGGGETGTVKQSSHQRDRTDRPRSRRILARITFPRMPVGKAPFGSIIPEALDRNSSQRNNDTPKPVSKVKRLSQRLRLSARLG